MPKPVLIIQLRPDDETSDSEYQAFLRYRGLDASDALRMRYACVSRPMAFQSRWTCPITAQ